MADSDALAGAAMLDNPARASLLGPHAHLARQCGDVLAYPSDMSPFLGLPDQPDAQAWRDAATLLGSGSTTVLAGIEADPPAGWKVAFDVGCLQMIFPRLLRLLLLLWGRIPK